MKKCMRTNVEENGEYVELEVESKFIEFYKKETGHSRVTKKGVTRFLNNLINFYEKRSIKNCF